MLFHNGKEDPAKQNKITLCLVIEENNKHFFINKHDDSYV